MWNYDYTRLDLLKSSSKNNNQCNSYENNFFIGTIMLSIVGIGYLSYRLNKYLEFLENNDVFNSRENLANKIIEIGKRNDLFLRRTDICLNSYIIIDEEIMDIVNKTINSKKYQISDLVLYPVLIANIVSDFNNYHLYNSHNQLENQKEELNGNLVILLQPVVYLIYISAYVINMFVAILRLTNNLFINNIIRISSFLAYFLGLNYIYFSVEEQQIIDYIENSDEYLIEDVFDNEPVCLENNCMLDDLNLLEAEDEIVREDNFSIESNELKNILLEDSISDTILDSPRVSTRERKDSESSDTVVITDNQIDNSNGGYLSWLY